MDFERFEPGFWAGLTALCVAAYTAIKVIVDVPPPSRAQLTKGAFEVVLAFPIAFALAVGFAEPLSHFLTNLLASQLGESEINPIGAGVFIGFCGVEGFRFGFKQVIMSKLNRGNGE